MNVKRKTVRFKDNLTDLSAYEAISDYKKYGYRSESHMVIEAVQRLIKGEENNSEAERIADLIVERLSEKLSVSPTVGSDKSEDEGSSENAAYDAALSFLDSF